MTADNNFNEPTDFTQRADFDARRLRELASAWCDESLSDADARELEAMLSASAAARSMYVRYLNLHAGLDWEITSSESVAGMLPIPRTTLAPARDSSQHDATVWKMAAVAAALLLIASLAFVGRRANDGAVAPVEASENELASKIDQQPVTAAPVMQVATVKRLGPNAQWAVTPHPGASPMELREDGFVYELRENDDVCVTAGEIQVTFKSGAEVTLYAPAIMKAISPMKGSAIRGRLAANVPEGAQGFTIETPQATVVDLGTVFGVEVGDGDATDVVVFKGAVDLHFEGRHFDGRHFDGRPNADGRTSDAEKPLRLTSGEALRLDKEGTPSRIVSIYSDRFSSPPDGSTEDIPPSVLISAVTDNIDREGESWNYYEIVHGGMDEDAKAFVDRVAHEWNGLFTTGMPKFLLGGDYVKTFNNDKYSRNLELFVTIDRPCRLYILIDDRVPSPAWLTSQFHDTGANIALDVGPFYRVEDGVLIDDRMPGVGPGMMVDNVFSVWERAVETPQIVHLGANEAGHRYINMYGIVATPLADAPLPDAPLKDAPLEAEAVK